MIDVPAVVRNKAAAVGASGWVAALPDLVAALAEEWSFAAGEPFRDATEALVLGVTLADGDAAVLKLVMPRDGAAAEREITALRLADGQGCVRLLREDVARGALLIERLGPSLHDLGLPLAQRHEILCATATRFWRRAPDANLPTGASKALWLSDFIEATWERLDRPCPVQVIDQALAAAARRGAAHDDERAVLVHGDVHEWNALAAVDGFRLVDPDGLLAEPAYDLGVLMREDPVELRQGDPFDRARWLAARTGLDATAIWEWGIAERVATGLLCTEIDLQPVGREMLTTAALIAGC